LEYKYCGIVVAFKNKRKLLECKDYRHFHMSVEKKKKKFKNHGKKKKVTNLNVGKEH